MHRIILSSQYARDRAKGLIDRAPAGFVMSIAEPKRSSNQNDKMWSMLTDISVSKPLGELYTPDDWKPRVMHACGWESQFLPGILDGKPFPSGFRSSLLNKTQMSTLIDWMQAWGDDCGVRWTNEQELAA